MVNMEEYGGERYKNLPEDEKRLFEYSKKNYKVSKNRTTSQIMNHFTNKD